VLRDKRYSGECVSTYLFTAPILAARDGALPQVNPHDPRYVGVTHILVDPSCSSSGVGTSLETALHNAGITAPPGVRQPISHRTEAAEEEATHAGKDEESADVCGNGGYGLCASVHTSHAAIPCCFFPFPRTLHVTVLLRPLSRAPPNPSAGQR